MRDVVVDGADDAEAVDHLVVDEGGVGRADLGVVEVVVALAVAHVAGQRRRQLLGLVAVDEVDDVVADQRREPAHAIAALSSSPTWAGAAAMTLISFGSRPACVAESRS